jgi:choline kinase
MTKVIILVAGEGTRFRPYTLDRPKCLVEVNGKGLLDYQLDVLRNQHIEPIVLVTGYLADKLQHYRLRTYFNERYADTNMVWTLFCAESEMTGEVIVSYGDIVYSKEVLHALIQSPHDIAVVIDREWETYWCERFTNLMDDAETLKIDQQGKIVEIGQSPKTLDDIEGQYIGLMKFTEKGLSILRAAFASGSLGEKTAEKAYMTDILQAIIKAGHDVWPVFIEGDWIEIDTVNDLNLEITKQRLKKISQI